MGSFNVYFSSIIKWRLSTGSSRFPNRIILHRLIILGLSLLFIFAAGRVVGQNNMLIRKLSGKEIQRLSYDKEGHLESKQVFQISKLDSSKGSLSVKINIQFFDKNGTLVNNYISNYTCEPDKSDLLLTAIPLSSNQNTEYVVEANAYNFKSLYNFSGESRHLDDVRLNVNVRSGVLGFLASKSKITISNRKLIREEQDYVIKSDLTIDAFLLGIRIKTIRYRVVENLSGDRSLVSQKFMREDGSYFSINYISNF